VVLKFFVFSIGFCVKSIKSQPAGRWGNTWVRRLAQDDKDEAAAALRQVRRLMTLITMQNTLAGIKPNWAVLMPMMHMMTLFTVASSQPSQHRRPTKIVEVMVNTQDR
jgi:hypothetical protein